MKAVVIDSYGPPEVLKVTEVPIPIIRSSELLVRVKAFAVNSADARIRGSRFPKGFELLARVAFGLIKPRTKILGNVYSGVIEAVGNKVTQFKVGDEVCGMTGIQMRAYAEYIRVSGFNSIAHKPLNISHEDAAAVLFGGTAALHFVRDKLTIKSNETVLVNGASGAVGIAAVQLAKYYGARITAVTSSANEKLVKDLGAEQCIDRTKQDISAINRTFDVIIDTVGNISVDIAKRMLSANGRAGLMVAGLIDILFAAKHIKTGTATEKKEDIEFLLQLMLHNKLRAVIERRYALSEIVDAHHRIDSGRKVGNIVVGLRF